MERSGVPEAEELEEDDEDVGSVLSWLEVEVEEVEALVDPAELAKLVFAPNSAFHLSAIAPSPFPLPSIGIAA